MKTFFSKKNIRSLHKLLLAIMLGSFCYSCQQGQAAPSPIYLEGLSATSVKIGYDKYGPHNVFQKDNYWATMPGAAPNEGLLLRFSKEVYIKEMEIVLPQDSSISKITQVGIVLNGVKERKYSLEKAIPIREKIKSLYIRVLATNFYEYKNNRRRYRSDLSTGIQQLIFKGEDNQPLTINPPRVVKGSIQASSTLSPAEAYSTDFLFDSRSEFGWVEGAKGSGKGESLTFSFQNKVRITKLQIWNGYQRSKVHYYANERVKTCSFGLGSDADNYNLQDSMEPQTIDLKKNLEGKTFTLQITDIYKGKKYKDCVISELRFFDGKQWFLIDSGAQDRKKAALIKKIKKTVLEKIIDRNINFSDGEVSRSLILRSNNAFVFWDEGNWDSISEKNVYDGNWQLVSLSPNKATLKIFGKEMHLTKEYRPYKGSIKNETTKIFSDELLIDSTTIKAKKIFKQLEI